MPLPATVRALALDGTWETIGADRAAGIWIENLVPEYDEWGPVKCTFDLRRHASRPWPDIGAFAPIDVEIGGIPAWSGRVADTPSRDGQDRVMSVQCDGPQFHLDDDLFERAYVHNKLGDWRDQRSFANANLTQCRTVGQVQAGDGVMLLTWPSGSSLVADDIVGVTLDLGAHSTVSRIAVEWERIGGSDANAFFYARCTDTDNLDQAPLDDAFAIGLTTAGTTTIAAFSTGMRYVHLFLFRTTSTTLTSDQGVRIKAVRVFTDAAYEAAGESVLKASAVVNDGLDRATLLLSPDRSGIQATTTTIPTYAPDSPMSARKAWLDVDAFHDWVKQVDVYWRPIYKPKPATPVLEIGSWSPGELNDTSANSGDEIYSRGLLTGETPDGQSLRAERTQAQQPAVPLIVIDAADNPSFATDTASWTASGGTLTRTMTAGEFDTAPAGGKWVVTAGGQTLTETFTGTFRAGASYVLKLVMKTDGAAQLIVGKLGQGDDVTSPLHGMVVTAAFFTHTITWTPEVDRAAVTLVLTAQLAGTLYVDSLVLARPTPTLVERRGFRRTKELPIGAPLPDDLVAANIIVDTWLSGHKATPFKGTRTLDGAGSIRDLQTGQNIGLHTLGLRTMEMIRFSDHIDPDTGGVGRDGRMTKVRYVWAEDSAEVTIDNSRASFEALLARFAVVTGSG